MSARNDPILLGDCHATTDSATTARALPGPASRATVVNRWRTGRRGRACHDPSKLAKSTIVPVKPEEAETHKKLVEGAVLAGWAKRCGIECAKEWNETVGKMLGLKAPTS